MARVLKEIKDDCLPAGHKRFFFHCPGCDEGHCVISGRWTWNESLEKPTFNPSILTGFGKDSNGAPNYSQERCHSYIKDGQIQFLSDCHHNLKGQTVDLPSVEHMY